MNERGVGTTLLGGDLGARVSRGAVAGIAAGLLFLLANMAWATKSGMPGVAPLIDMATIFNVTDKPDPTPENIAIGLVTHLNLSMLFGIGFALIVPVFRDPRTMALAGAGYRIALYLVTSRSWAAPSSHGSRRDRTSSSRCSRTPATGCCWCRSW
jgi:hypothetical protein